MSRRVLEINDLGLHAADADGLRIESPGLILCGQHRGGSEMLIGAAAATRQRINPRATHDRFWFALDDAPLPRAVGPAQSHADLAWLHLRDALGELRRGAEDDRPWTVAVPGEMDDSRLALLLGILASHRLRVDRLVPAPLAAAAAAGPGASCVVLDAHRHHFSAIEVDYRLGEYRVAGPGAPLEPGLAMLFDRMAELVTGAFLAQARFDPSRDAEIEQVLYDRLPDWLARLADGMEVEAELPAGSHRYRTRLEPAPFIEAGARFFQPLGQRLGERRPEVLVVRHRLKGLPGLAQVLDASGRGEMRWLDAEALVRTTLELPPALSESDGGSAVPLTLVWPRGRASTVRATAKPKPDRLEPPTHALIDGRAHPVGARLELGDGWSIEADPNASQVRLVGPAGAEVSCNEQPVGAGHALSVGDRIRIAGREFMLLRVEDDAQA